MTRRWGVLLALFATSTTLVASPTQPRIERTPDFLQRVNDAIDRGVLWLKTRQTADGGFPDVPGFEGATTAIAYHTLRVCGVGRDDPVATAAWEALRRGYVREKLRTYSAALYLMAIWSHGDPVPKTRDDHDRKLSAADQHWAEEIARSVVSGQSIEGCWTYGVGGDYGATDKRYDHSNTQYGLLGLKAAARCGVAVDPVVWKRALVHFLAAQEKDGPEVQRGGVPATKGSTNAEVMDHARGWSYVGSMGRTNRGAYPSMTAGGVSSVVICRSELLGTSTMTTKLDVESERAAWDGVAWLGRNWHPPAPQAPGPRRKGLVGGVNCYEYYGVERAGVLAGVEWMGDLDWYGAGAAALLDAQSPDGAWDGGAEVRVAPGKNAMSAQGLTDDCFALLFLKRGTTPVRRGAVTAPFDDTDINFAAAAGLKDQDFEDFVDLVLSRWRKCANDGVKARLFDGAVSVGPRVVEPLLVRLDSPNAEIRASAHALLARATGLDFGFVASADDDARADAVLKWQTWWMGAKAKIGYDVETKRLVGF